ncbi:MAG: hypothetical protein IRZ32_17865, partial [Solirubrobacteraceae bacterium]|nr:hypothetical protein [Solirubrobacteraceae bacterium]
MVTAAGRTVPVGSATAAVHPAGTHGDALGGVGVALGLLPGEPGHAGGPWVVGRLAAVGEVTLHNRAELLAWLASAGVAVGPDAADGELLLRCYARFGANGIGAAEGMFALAIADGAELVLVRDHVGARTLFHAYAGGCWLAASSLRALRRWPAVGGELD